MLGIYYEHPDWFRPLFTELDRRGVPYAKLHADTHSFDPARSDVAVRGRLQPDEPVGVARGDAGDAIFYTRSTSRTWSGTGVRVLNGTAAFATEISKASSSRCSRGSACRFRRPG